MKQVISCVIPVYDLSMIQLVETIERLPDKIERVVIALNDAKRTSINKLYSINTREIVFIDIGMQVGKAEALRRGINLSLRKFNSDIIVQLDGDLKQRPEDLQALISLVSSGNSDFAIANRYGYQNLRTQNHRMAGSQSFSILVSSLTGIRLPDVVCGMRAYNRDLAKLFVQSRSFGYGVEVEQVIIAAMHKAKISYQSVVSNIQHGATNAEKIEDNLYAILSYSSDLKISDSLLSMLCNILVEIKKRNDFQVDLDSFAIKARVYWKYLGIRNGKIGAYSSGTLNDGYELNWLKKDINKNSGIGHAP